MSSCIFLKKGYSLPCFDHAVSSLARKAEKEKKSILKNLKFLQKTPFDNEQDALKALIMMKLISYYPEGIRSYSRWF